MNTNNSYNTRHTLAAAKEWHENNHGLVNNRYFERRLSEVTKGERITDNPHTKKNMQYKNQRL